MTYRGRNAARRASKAAKAEKAFRERVEPLVQKARSDGRGEGMRAMRDKLNMVASMPQRGHYEDHVLLTEVSPDLSEGRGSFMVGIPNVNGFPIRFDSVQWRLDIGSQLPPWPARGGMVRNRLTWFNLEPHDMEERKKAKPAAVEVLSLILRHRHDFMRDAYRYLDPGSEARIFARVDAISAALLKWLGDWKGFLDIAQSDAVQRLAEREEMPW